MLTEQLTARREQIVRDYFDSNDTQDWDVIRSFFADEMEFRVGNAEPIRSLDILQENVQTNLKSSEVTLMLHLIESFIHDPQGRYCVSEIEVQLARADGRTFTGPCIAVFRFDADDRIESYHAYLDPGDFWL
ncbi:nuclear transport factor 2 family protein [Williamsia muralis]|uniref:SnoaL-like domain-containing protein n=1 Tax=Williamsia marianensis TaxID=85044 RepID=A0A2G3PMW8_WILMA|nr:nuclear transport factor 2 family protein [Williamsia marianensis]PHV67135.1 hypothetical protein CSW57_13110 [Williamsia marianensis]